MTSAFGISALQGDLDALADATADSGGLAGDIVQLTTRVVNGMRFGMPKLEELDDEEDDPDEWVAVDNGGEYVVVGPEFMLTANADGTSATIVHGSVSWSLFRGNDPERSWRVTALDGGDIAVDVTIAGGDEIDNRDTDAINDEVDEHMQRIVDEVVDHEAEIFEAAESGESTTATSFADASSDAESTPSPSAASDADGGGADISSIVAGTAATMAAGAVVSRARKALSGRSKGLPPPPPPPATAAWRPTHVVPAPGLSAWSVPDGNVAPVTTLAAGVQLVLAQVQGPWAEVVASNGWRGWVDMARLLPAPP